MEVSGYIISPQDLLEKLQLTSTYCPHLKWCLFLHYIQSLQLLDTSDLYIFKQSNDTYQYQWGFFKRIHVSIDLWQIIIFGMSSNQSLCHCSMRLNPHCLILMVYWLHIKGGHFDLKFILSIILLQYFCPYPHFHHSGSPMNHESSLVFFWYVAYICQFWCAWHNSRS